MVASLLAYLGPETVLPAMSILAAIGGFLLAGFSYLTAPFRWIYGAVTGKQAKQEEQNPSVPN